MSEQTFTEEQLVDAHKHCIKSKEQIEKSTIFGCFYCISIYDRDLLDTAEWPNEKTVLCPFCSIDSIIGDESGYEITKEFLIEMSFRWFGDPKEQIKKHFEKLKDTIHRYKTVEEMLEALSPKLADDFKKHQSRWSVRFRHWYLIKIIDFKIFCSKIKNKFITKK